MAIRGGRRDISSVALLCGLVSDLDGAAIIQRIGGDGAELAGDLDLLQQAEFTRGRPDEAAERTAAVELDDVFARAALLAEGDGDGAIGVAHLLAAFAAPECQVRGAALLRDSLSRRADQLERDHHVATDGDRGRGSVRHGNEITVAEQSERWSHEAKIRQSACAGTDHAMRLDRDAQGIEAALATLARELAIVSERLGRLERQAEDRAAGMAEMQSFRGGHFGADREERVSRARARRAERAAQVVVTAPASGGSGDPRHGTRDRNRAQHSTSERSSERSAASQPGTRQRLLRDRASALRRRLRAEAKARRSRVARGLRRAAWLKLRDARHTRGSVARQARRAGRRMGNSARGPHNAEARHGVRAVVGLAPDRPEIVTDDDLHAVEDGRGKRFYLAVEDAVVDAPSIGPRTAARLEAVGLRTVRDLLRADATRVAARIEARWIKAETVAAWQAQARLVCTIPWLRGTHAQLLVGAGYGTAEALCAAEPAAVSAALLRFAASREGQSILRNGAPPDIEKIKRWLDQAHEAEVERVA